MKKKIVSISLALGLCLTSVVGFAKDSTDDLKNLSTKETPELKIELDKDKAIEFINALKEKQEAQKENENSGISTFAPAPKLTYLEVFAVGSTQYLEKYGGSGYEFVGQHQFSTLEDHGGRQLIVVTAELGMTSPSRIAEFKGGRLKLIDYEYIDDNNDSIIDGYFYYWDASGTDPRTDHGDFTYRAWSQNFPYNEMSDSIYIK